MTKEKLAEILEQHKLWLNNEGGSRANLRWANLSEADLSRANLSRANLSEANLSRANLSEADLSEANLSRANLSGANLRWANLRWADLSEANLSEVDLSEANLRWADLSEADLSRANLSEANLSRANLSEADLSEADLSEANLRWADLSEVDLSRANLSGANLSGAKGLLSTVNFLEAHFERTEAGYIVYKCFNGTYAKPDSWELKKGAVIEEVVNFDRCTECGCGINVAPVDWVKKYYPKKTIWKLLIRWEWLCGVCVPYMSDGKIRCEKAELLEIVTE